MLQHAQFQSRPPSNVVGEFTRENLISYIDSEFVCPVPHHMRKPLEMYCQTCKKAICQICAATRDHSNHPIVSLGEACEDIKRTARQRKDQLREEIEVHENERMPTVESIQNQLDQVNTALCDVLQAQIPILRSIQQHKEENDSERRAINDTLYQARSLIDQCVEIENLNLKYFIVKRREEFQEVCEAVFEGIPSLPRRPLSRFTSVRYVPNPGALQILQNLELGRIDVSVTDPSQCTIESVGHTRCGFMNEFNFITRDENRNECYTDESLIDVQIQDNEGTQVDKEITQSQPGTFIVKYKAQVLSPYKLDVSIGGTPISNSPQVAQTIHATAELTPVRTFETRAEFRQLSVAVNDSGMIAVTNNDLNGQGSVGLYSVDNQIPREIGGEGAAEEFGLRCPRGALFVNERHVLVSDYHEGLGELKLFEVNGNFKQLILRKEGMIFTRMCATISNIACLAYDENSGKTTIKLFAKHSCNHLQDIELDISADVGCPLYVAYDSNRYFVTFNNGQSIYVFDENGALLNTFGRVKKPRGLAMFGADMFLVCDADEHHMKLFDKRGYLIRSFCSRGSGRGQIRSPKDVVVTPNGKVTLLEYSGRRVQVFT